MKTQKQAYHKPADEQKFTNLWATFKEIRLYFSNIYIPNLLIMKNVRQNWREEILNTKPSSGNHYHLSQVIWEIIFLLTLNSSGKQYYIVYPHCSLRLRGPCARWQRCVQGVAEVGMRRRRAGQSEMGRCTVGNVKFLYINLKHFKRYLEKVRLVIWSFLITNLIILIIIIRS